MTATIVPQTTADVIKSIANKPLSSSVFEKLELMIRDLDRGSLAHIDEAIHQAIENNQIRLDGFNELDGEQYSIFKEKIVHQNTYFKASLLPKIADLIDQKDR
jgi:hypothetical protein